jgi:FAD:protein FMN transferase
MIVPLFLLLACQVSAAPILVPPSGPATGTVVREAWVMGTRLQVRIEAADPIAGRAAEAALREVERLDTVLSTWHADAEMARANAAPAGRPAPLSAELAGLLAEALAWSRRTDRAFDPAVGALIDAWDLRGPGRTPAAPLLDRARAATGPAGVAVEGTALVRRSDAAWIDTGGFGKGAALRAALVVLRRAGVTRATLDLGGQLLVLAPEAAPAVVAVAHPTRREQPAARLRLAGVSASTSGLSERPGHILDPRTGRPVPAWGSVTVVSDDPLAADALSTALFVMGPDVGLAWARAHGIAALFLLDGSPGLRAAWSPAMTRWLDDLPAGAAGPA